MLKMKKDDVRKILNLDKAFDITKFYDFLDFIFLLYIHNII